MRLFSTFTDAPVDLPAVWSTAGKRVAQLSNKRASWFKRVATSSAKATEKKPSLPTPASAHSQHLVREETATIVLTSDPRESAQLRYFFSILSTLQMCATRVGMVN